MLSQGATPQEMVEGYPSLDKERVALAPFLYSSVPSSRPTGGQALGKSKANSGNPSSPFTSGAIIEILD
jgi:hypothetical protein